MWEAVSGGWGSTYLLAGLCVLLYVLARWDGTFFERRGLVQAPGYIPLMGHMLKVFTQREHIMNMSLRIYRSSQQKYIGFRQLLSPVVMITDVELLKQVAVKDFDHFQDHRTAFDEEVDPLFGRNLLSLKGQRWRDMRATLSPAFTSSKMKSMFQFIVECAHQTVEFFEKEMEKDDNKERGHVHVEMKDAFCRYTNDVIATSAFGIKVDSLSDRDNEFYLMGKEAVNFTGLKLVKFMITASAPKVMKFSIFSKRVSTFFRTLVIGTMDTRERENIVRPDMIHLLMQARKGALQHDHKDEEKDAGFATVEESNVGKQTSKIEWVDDDITAQAILFFLAGFDTSSILLCFMAHELAVHGEAQRRLQQEVDMVFSRNGGKLVYQELQEMKYMDMVVSETLRLWPPLGSVDRQCTKPYTLPPATPGAKPYPMKVGECIWVPIAGLHYDPKYFPDPKAFDPERFSDERKGSIVPFSYIPFGIGPRNCIGSRFALMEAKAVMFYILSKFDIILTEKSQVPIQMANNSFMLKAKDGFWLGLKPRSKATDI